MTEVDRISDFAHDTGHVQRGLAAIPRQFQNRPRVAALVVALLTEVQAVEDAAWAVLECTLDNAVGQQLDQIGRVIGGEQFPRGNNTDGGYRLILRMIVKARRSSGTAPEIQDIVALVATAFGLTFTYTEGNAGIIIGLSDYAGDLTLMWEVLQLAKPGGVTLQLLEVPAAANTGVAGTFKFSSDQFRSNGSSTQGFSNSAQTTGGHLMGVHG